MALPMVETSTLEQIHSPYSGLPVDGEDGPNETDPTVLFVHYGDAGEGTAFVSARVVEALGPDAGNRCGDELTEMLSIPGGIAIHVDRGWNGYSYYGFAPLTTGT